MSSSPRLRMIAGPNGSGKSTLTNYLFTLHFNFGFYINADELEAVIGSTGLLDFDKYKVKVSEQSFKSFLLQHPLYPEGFDRNVAIKDNKLFVNQQNAKGYAAAIIADFIRKQLLNAAHSFTFETVMSAPDKIELLKAAKEKGYRTYLYYITTDNVLINKDRVANRVKTGGHSVPESKIESRYIRSLDLLLDAIKNCDKAYLFDNSGKEYQLIAEVTNGKQIELKTREIPTWFIKAVYNKIT